MTAPRRLIHVPIIHTAADLGSLAESVRAHYTKTLGPAGWSQRQQAVESLWDHIRGRLEGLNLDARRVRIYQDGLPVCGFERQIVQELANAGSANHQLVLDLVDRGATLMGTEEPRLLIREYEMQRLQTQNPSRSTIGEQASDEAPRLLEDRDRFIAQRIDETLLPGEVGLLFLGAAHRLEAPGIGVETLRIEP